MNKKKNYIAKLRDSELFSDEARREASELVENLETIYKKTNQEELLKKKKEIQDRITKFEETSN